MTTTLLYMALPAYLLIGCILMLVVNELAHGAVTRTEFVKGMIVWPVLICHFIGFFLSVLIARIHG